MVVVLALLPWWHNHGYLRDFYDYGLVMSANGRIPAGERPYVDFVSPIQSATLLANLGAEKIFGGTFVGMTWGLAGFIGLCGVGFTALLARRWPTWLAALVTMAVVTGSLSQHTIFWHNTFGVIFLAIATWAAAIAPVLRRSTWRWHLLLWAGLFLGGITKLNFQLLALAVVTGWAVREGVTGRAGWTKVAGTFATTLIVGVVLPVLFELSWTHASLAGWWHSVVAVPLSARGGDLGRLASWQMLWTPVHDYYGTLTLRPIGGLCLLTTGGAAWAAWRKDATERGRLPLVIGAGLLAAAGALGLFATNFEIGYVSLSAALVLAVSLWLGFGAIPRGTVAWITLILPTILLSVGAWESAWRGQRSQFGHAGMDRESYVDGGTLGPAFSYFRGLHIPDAWAVPASAVEATLPAASPKGTRPVFYGQGLEWLERAFPADKYRGLPLWMHFGTSYGPEETAMLNRLLGDESEIQTYYFGKPWSYLPPALAQTLSSRYEKIEMPGFMTRWIRSEINGPSPENETRPLGLSMGMEDGIGVISATGGNANPLDLVVEGADFSFTPRAAGQDPILGTSTGRTTLVLSDRIQHFVTNAIVRRIQPGSDPVYARFSLRHHVTRGIIWTTRITLAGETNQNISPINLRSAGGPVDLTVEVPEKFAGRIAAGYAQIFIQQTEVPADERPPRLRPAAPADESFDLSQWRNPFPDPSWTMTEAVGRGAAILPDGFTIAPGGELWFRAAQPFIRFNGTISLPDSTPESYARARLVYAKGPRLDVLTHLTPTPENNSVPLRGWSPEREGWFGILNEASSARTITVKFTGPAP